MSESGLKCYKDCKVGYFPEEFNLGDKVKTLNKIMKIVSAIDDESRYVIANV